MRSRTICLAALMVLVTIVTPLLVGCGATATPTATTAAQPTQAAATAAPTTAATKAAPTATVVPPTATPQGPTVGGTFTYALSQEPATLDSYRSPLLVLGYFSRLIGATLVDREPDSGKFVGYLAESWKASDDGLTWTFTLKKGVKFSNGQEVTAKDWDWTFKRAKDPATKTTNSTFQYVDSTSAPDDYTFVIKLKLPYAPLLHALSFNMSMQVLCQSVVEKAGDSYGREPVGAGPYTLKQWVTGQSATLERRADYNWGPSYMHKGPWYIQTIVIKFITEQSTINAGLEAGELDNGFIAPKDIERIRALKTFQIFEGLNQGMSPVLLMNLTKAPFDDLKFRQAVSYAVDKANLVKVAAQGNAVPLNGPYSSSQTGYWPGIEEYGYKYDAAKAKALLAEMGYKAGANGMLEKDGQPLKIVLSAQAFYSADSQVISQQLKAVGIDLQIQEAEVNSQFADLVAGKYQCALFGIGNPDPDIMWLVLHSKQMGAINMSQLKDPEMDKLLDAERSATDPDKRNTILIDVQKYIVDHAFFVPLYAPKNYVPVSNRVQGVKFCQQNQALYLNDAYIVAK